VLTTLHANSSISAFSRLVNMGLPRYLVAEAATLVASQRLMRRLHDCARWEEPSAADLAVLKRLGQSEGIERVNRANGCPGCNGTGYRGRVAVAEVLSTDAVLRQMITESASVEELNTEATKQGFVTLSMDGIRHLENGTTSIDELRRVLLSGGD